MSLMFFRPRRTRAHAGLSLGLALAGFAALAAVLAAFAHL